MKEKCEICDEVTKERIQLKQGRSDRTYKLHPSCEALLLAAGDMYYREVDRSREDK